jgi:hypothetical protein
MTQQTRIWATGPSGEVLPVVCDAQGNLVIQLEGATVNVGDVDVISSALPTGAATSANQLLTYKGQDRTTTTGAAEEITIPSGSKRVYISCDPSSKGNLNINADATTSAFYISSHRDLPAIDLLGVTKLSTWMVAGNASFLFFG